MFVDELINFLFAQGLTVVSASAEKVEQVGNSVVVSGNEVDESFDQVLVAAGAWSNIVATGVKLPLVSGFGYSFSVRPENMPKHTLILEDAHVGATPLNNDRLRIAGTMELGFRKEGITQSRVEGIVKSAAPLLQGIDWTSIEDVWGAPRPMSHDGVPYIGPVPKQERVFIATGHNMLGFSLAPSTGDLIARMMGNEANQETKAAFSLRR